MKPLLAALLALCLVACSATKSTVTVFHDLAGPQTGKTFIMVPLKAQEGSLEWRAYAGQVAAKLQEQGLRQTDHASDADYAVFIAYSIGQGRTSVDSVPMYGQTSPGTTQTTTNVIGGRSYTFTNSTPATYGITGYAPVSTTMYGRQVKIVMTTARATLQGQPIKTVYEATANSEGESDSLNVVFPNILTAIFRDWPGKSGATEERIVQDK